MDMAVSTAAGTLKQHLIDPEICIRCNTCEATCPTGAITHDSRNYVVNAEVCNLCMACIPPCPTGSIDNWRVVPIARAYSIDEQLQWDVLPAELPADQLAAETAGEEAVTATPEPATVVGVEEVFNAASFGATLPPWSAAHAYTNLYG